eukprot:GILI01021493.1.p1 GENE.GILI01021493.1~~GILI01021493.1.p1  ORF type:complete len:250 (+),score=36.09 GILI01021493.1:48-797(+)
MYSKTLSSIALFALGLVGAHAAVKVVDKDEFIVIGNCSQVSMFVTPYPSIGFYQIGVCWDQGAYCGVVGAYGTQDQVLQQAIMAFVDNDPPCLNNASAVGPTPTYYTATGCSDIAVFAFPNATDSMYGYTTACWGNGQYCGIPAQGTDANSVQLALGNFVLSGAPCIATTSAPPTYYITLGGCTNVGVYVTSYHDDPDTNVQVCWMSVCGAVATSASVDQATQQAIANFEATNPSCLGPVSAPPALKSV